MAQLSQADVGSALQIFFNLQMLPEVRPALPADAIGALATHKWADLLSAPDVIGQALAFCMGKSACQEKQSLGRHSLPSGLPLAVALPHSLAFEASLWKEPCSQSAGYCMRLL